MYNEEYYSKCCGPIPYENADIWVPHFELIADRLVRDFNPKTVLDAGCAMGYLVAALRDRNIEAYGLDISEYAISQVREDIRPFCNVGSLQNDLPDEFPKNYDLVVCIEVLEHMYEEEGLAVIQRLCNYSDHILFSSTADDILEATHFNVQQPEYWIKHFAKNSLFNQLNYIPDYISSAAVYLNKSENIIRVIEDYQRKLRQNKTKYDEECKIVKMQAMKLQEIIEEKALYAEQLSNEKKQITLSLGDLIKEKDTEIYTFKEQNKLIQSEIEELKELLEEKNMQSIDACNLIYTKQEELAVLSKLLEEERSIKDSYKASYEMILYSTIWRMSKPLRTFLDFIKHKIRLKNLVSLVKKTHRSLAQEGLKVTYGKIKNFSSEKKKLGVSGTAIASYSDNNTESGQYIKEVTGHPIDPISTIICSEKIKRLNLVTDSISKESLLGGVATALIVATQFANCFNYELRIITRIKNVNPIDYENIMKVNGIEPAKKISFYSDYDRNQNKKKIYKLEITKDDIFMATSWWSALTIKKTSLRKNYFYIIQEVETFFYSHNAEHYLCSQIMQDDNADFIINSHYLYEYFKENISNIGVRGVHFEPAFPKKLYKPKKLEDKKKYKMFFYARPNNPRNLYTIGISLINKALEMGVIDINEWDIYCAGQEVKGLKFSNGYMVKSLGLLSWDEYGDFLGDVDLGISLMYTPHPSYPPYDIVCSGGVALTNKCLNKENFEQCKNFIVSDLEENKFMQSLSEAIILAKDVTRRRENYNASTIPRDWCATLKETMVYMERKTTDVQN